MTSNLSLFCYSVSFFLCRARAALYPWNYNHQNVLKEYFDVKSSSVWFEIENKYKSVKKLMLFTLFLHVLFFLLFFSLNNIQNSSPKRCGRNKILKFWLSDKNRQSMFMPMVLNFCWLATNKTELIKTTNIGESNMCKIVVIGDCWSFFRDQICLSNQNWGT